jgi:molecular chaperone GrpE
MMMMVKKKTTETDDNKDRNNSEIIENKDNKQPATGEEGNVTGSSPEEGGAKAAEESESPSGSDADKVVSEEKVFEAKLAEMQDRYLRLSAEFDNYRKRTLREKMDISNLPEKICQADPALYG